MDKKIKKVYEDIKSIKIQGATNVARAVGQALLTFVADNKKTKIAEVLKELKIYGKYLLSARETEPMAQNVYEFLLFLLSQKKFSSTTELFDVLKKDFVEFLNLVEQNEQQIISYGSGLIESNDKIFTHCHSTTVIKSLFEAKKEKKKFSVFQTETRPLYQGHRTAIDLTKNKIDDTLVVDSAAGYLLSSYSNEKISFAKVLLGCDAISSDGSCVNKVGSFGLALAAFQNNVPVYVFTQALKLDEDARNYRQIKIEKRPAKEVWPQAPKGLQIMNLAFDLIPAEFITAYVTEFGLLAPEKFAEIVTKKYSWLKNK